MAYNPTFNSFSLQDDNYVTTEIEYRTIPSREIITEPIARREGVKLLSQQFGARAINIRGFILASSYSDLIDKIDSLHSNVTRQDLSTLQVDSERSIEAVVKDVRIGDPHYSQSMVPMEIQLIAPDPFFRAGDHTVNFTSVSGVMSQTFSLSISGSIFTLPTITYTTPSGAGDTPLTRIDITYNPTGETVTWSGGDGPMAYSDSVVFDYFNEIITETAVSADIAGIFSRWNPGDTTFDFDTQGTVTSGNMGGTVTFTYKPTYL